MSGLVIGNAKWQAIFSVLFLNHLQHSPTRGWWPQTHLEAARAVIPRCAGKTSQRALTALSVLMLERKDKVKHFAYSIQLLVRSVLKSPLLICSFFHNCCISEYFGNTLLSSHCVKVEGLFRWETFWNLFLRKAIWRKKMGKMLHICTQMKRRNWWSCRTELETSHQSTLKWLCLLNSPRGNQHTVVTGKVGKS